MNFRHYEIFQAVAETGNFRIAAEKLFLTQSAVSHAIKELETRTGSPLFDRHARGVRLTGSGRLLLEEVTPLLAAARALESRLDRLEEQAPVLIASSITIATFILPSVLKELQSRRPEAQIRVQVVSAAAAAGILRQGKAELALVEGAVPAGPFQIFPFAAYSLQAVCAPEYRAAGKTLTPQAFCAEKLLLREPGSAVRETLESALCLMGVQPRPCWCSVNSGALRAAAEAGLGIAVLPEELVQDQLVQGSLAPVSVEGLSLRNEMSALRHRGQALSAPVLELLSLLKGYES